MYNNNGKTKKEHSLRQTFIMAWQSLGWETKKALNDSLMIVSQNGGKQIPIPWK